MPSRNTAVKKTTKQKASDAPKRAAKKPESKKKPAAPVAAASAEENKQARKKTGKHPTLVRGMKDILPKEERFWKSAYHAAEDIAEAYGYGYMETPALEDASLFTRSIGKETDIVSKEMYMFDDRDGDKLALRPEFTAGIVRAYISHGMHTWPQPVKVWSYGALFRHERPQAGRFRQFHQFDCEVFGERMPVLDAELIALAYNFFRDLGITTQVHINSIGSAEDRERYTVELLGYLRSKRSYLPEEIKKRMVKNPLRVLDSKLEEMRPIIEEAPQIIDWLSDDSKKYFMTVLEYLDELDIPYVLSPTLVRGLDYYTDTVFEIYEDAGAESEQGSQSALLGGGRYDRLVQELGGQPTPAAGFAIGIERVIASLRKKEEGERQAVPEGSIMMPKKKEKAVFFAQLGEQARRRTLLLIEELRRGGIIVKHNLGKSALKAQLELANKFNVSHTLILGQKEVQDGTIIIRDMESGIQEIVDQKKLQRELAKILVV